MSSRKRVGWTGEQIKEAVDAVNGGMKIVARMEAYLTMTFSHAHSVFNNSKLLGQV
jgi:hypothetical protein